MRTFISAPCLLAAPAAPRRSRRVGVVTVSKLEGPVVVRARSPREVELFIEYELAVELK